MKIIIKLITLAIGFIMLISLYIDMTSTANLSDDGETQFKEFKMDISNFSQELNADDWDVGAPRVILNDKWSYSGAYLNLPKCISYLDFEKTIMKHGFKSAYGGALYCKKDINILSIRAEDEKVFTSSNSTKILLCGKIIFNVNWEKGQNSKNANCK